MRSPLRVRPNTRSMHCNRSVTNVHVFCQMHESSHTCGGQTQVHPVSKRTLLLAGTLVSTLTLTNQHAQAVGYVNENACFCCKKP